MNKPIAENAGPGRRQKRDRKSSPEDAAQAEPDTNSKKARSSPGRAAKDQDHFHKISCRTKGNGNKEQQCRTKGHIGMVLKRNKFFSKVVKKNKTKELVIKIQDRAISSHFPCFLINDELMPLNVEFISLESKLPPPPKQEKLCHYQVETFVVFHVDIKEGTNIVRNPAIRTLVAELTVYAYRGETVRSALRRDGRFHNVFTGHELLRLDTGDTMRLSAIVDNLNGLTVKIQLSCQLDSQPQSLEDDPAGNLPESQSSSQQDSQPESFEDDA